MINFIDRQPTQLGRRKITHEDGTSEYVIISMADNPDEAGTPLNRAILMALQGFESVTTVFDTDGNITETNADGEVLKTSFGSDGTMVEAFTGNNGMTITKTTTFNADGSISEVLSE